MECPGCKAENRPGRRFCSQCGTALALACPACGAENQPEDRFCGECGSPLTAGGSAGVAAPALLRSPAPVAERRLVSVLFADLVGFTTLSERRDPEAVRELLSGYFDRSRQIIERHGGTVEKFIGDAVMAVWGTPVAREDDAERAVRAALSLTQAVTALGGEVGMPELRVRAGVLTGNAAVDRGAENEGMVLGDTVNTASRLQSIAPPGTVLVDEVTRRATEAAVEYEDAGVHTVKGREQPVHAYTALRVVAGVGGARRSAGLEAPFVARASELQTIIDTAEASVAERRARLVAVVGEPGSGKSRLLWEYFKYLDGIEEVRWWHQGRCLAYGDGVAYWALAEMVRVRAGIDDEDRLDVARAKLRAAVEEFVADERERRLIEPRLAHLLRLEQRLEADRADLFAGWRLFLERLSEQAPVILAFEDLQWADSGLLDFIDYLLEWSAESPIFILALGRTDLLQRRSAWEPLRLAPLDTRAITDLLDGLVPGLPSDLVAEIVHRSEGIPLYAVETIRMLKDRGALVQSGAQYVVTGELGELEVPETLQALVASRLDGLAGPERTLLQDVSVLGQSFPVSAAAAVAGRPETEVAEALDALVAKQLLGHDIDPRSSERGEYTFLQALVRTVAYSTLSRRARKAKHLAAARHLEQTWPGEARDIAEVLADHYVQAIESEPDAPDADALRDSARHRLIEAGRAAARLALGIEADRYFAHAADLTSDDGERADLYELAGEALVRSNELDAAQLRLRSAIELHQRTGRDSGGSAAVTLAAALANTDQVAESFSLIDHFLAAEPHDLDPVLRARALAMHAHWRSLEGEPAAAEPLFAEAMQTLELQRAMPELAEAMTRRAGHLHVLERYEEHIALVRHAARLAEEYDVPGVVLRASHALGASLLAREHFAEALEQHDRALAAARERGDRLWEQAMISGRVQCLMFLGRWNDSAEHFGGIFADLGAVFAAWISPWAAQLAIARGEEALMRQAREVALRAAESELPEVQVIAHVFAAREHLARGDAAGTLEQVEPVLSQTSASAELTTDGYWLAAQAALQLDPAMQSHLVSRIDALAPLRRTPMRRAARLRLLAERAHHARDEPAALALEAEAEELLRQVGARPALVDALLDRVRRRADQGALAEARDILADLGASAWLAALEAPRSQLPA